ncbi:MAG: Trk system potassium transporter TrkA, partial [Pseudomonadota bacterium]
PAAFDTEMFMDGAAQLVGLRIDEDCPVIDTRLRHLDELFSTLRVVVVGVRREGRLFAPEPEDQLRVGDDAYILGPVEDIPRTMEVFGKTQQKQERLVIIGGGNIGLSVASSLEKRERKARVKVIERERKCAERAADLLERTIVLNGDGLDTQLLSEANISKADAVLAVTDDDKTNLLSAVRAKAEGCPYAIALVNDPTLVPLLEPLGIDAYINPRATTVSSILRHVRHGRVRAVYSLGDAEAEVIEAQVLSTSTIAGQTIRDIDFPEGVLVGAVMKDGAVVKPTGSLMIEANDVLVMFAMSEDVARVEQLLQVSIDFF